MLAPDRLSSAISIFAEIVEIGGFFFSILVKINILN